MAALSPEYCTIQRNTANITLKISTTTDLNFFADTLVENDFISKLTANGIVQTTGFTNYNKASQLMHAVESHISTASNPTTAFETFIKILKGINAPLKQLADELVQFYSKCFGHHFMIIIHSPHLLAFSNCCTQSSWCPNIMLLSWHHSYIISWHISFHLPGHVQLEPDYRGPFSSQGVSGPAPSSSLQGDLSMF